MSDLIDRQKAIDAALTFIVEYCGAAFDEDMQKMLCERLGDLPSAEPEKWIPAEEVLPKDMDRILATIVRSDGEKRVRSGHYYKGYLMLDNGDTWKATDKEVIAWMPLPEPWKGE